MADEYPESGLTDNLNLTLEGISSSIAQNFITLDSTIPIVNGVVNLKNINNPVVITGEPELENLLHFVSIYVDSGLDGGGISGDNILNVYLSWTDPSGDAINTLVGFIDGTDPNGAYLSVIIPVYPKVGTTMKVTTAYAGVNTSPTHFHYYISVAKILITGGNATTNKFVTTTNTGGAPSPIYLSKDAPIIQSSYTVTNSTNVTTPLSFQLPTQTLYQVTMYYFPSDSSGSGAQWWHPVFTWTTPEGSAATSLTSLGLGPCGNGDPTYGQAYSIPILCKANTPIVITGYYTVGGWPSYGGGPCTPFPIDLAIRIVAMP